MPEFNPRPVRITFLMDTRFLRVLRLSSVSIILPLLLHLNIILTRTNGRSLGIFKQSNAFSTIVGAPGRKVRSVAFFCQFREVTHNYEHTLSCCVTVPHALAHTFIIHLFTAVNLISVVPLRSDSLQSQPSLASVPSCEISR